MKENNIIVYCQIDEHSRIISVNSNIFISDLEGWIELDSSESRSRISRDSYAHAQGNYFPDGLIDGTGAHKYVYDPSITPRYRRATSEEMELERSNFTNTPNQLTEQEKLRADLDYVMLMMDLDVDPK